MILPGIRPLRIAPRGRTVRLWSLLIGVAAVCPGQTEAPIADRIAPAFGERSLFILHLPLLDFAPAHPQAPTQGHADWELTSAYANTFSTTEAVNYFHDLSSRKGQTLDAGEAAGLHADFPNQALLFVDGEVIRSALSVRYGVTSRLFVSIEVPYLDRSATADGTVRSFHRDIGQSENGRDLFPSGGLAVLIQPAGGPVTFYQGPRKSGFGDITVSAGWRAPLSSKGVAYGADIALKAPTGSPMELNGSGGWDAGFLLFALWRKGLWTIEADGTFVDPGTWKVPIQVEPDPFTRALLSVIRELGSTVRVGASATLAQSPFHDRRFSTLSRAGVELALGVEHDILPAMPLRLTLTENLPSFGDRADFAVGLSIRYR